MSVHPFRLTQANATPPSVLDLRRLRPALAIAAAALALCLLPLALAPGAEAYVYWTDQGRSTIGRANLDGTGVDPGFITGASEPYGIVPYGIAVDANQLYWSSIENETIGRFNLDGTGADQSLIPLAYWRTGITVDANHLYWANFATDTTDDNTGAGSISRANLDGTGVDQSFIIITGTGGPYDVAADTNHLYWATPAANTIGRANLDGTGVDPGFITGASGPYGVAVDANHLYWTNLDANTIGRANLDGTRVDQSFIGGGEKRPDGVAVDANHVYWVSRHSIGRANLDGTHVDQSFIANVSEPGDVAVDTLPGTTPPQTKIDQGRSEEDQQEQGEVHVQVLRAQLDLRVQARQEQVQALHVAEDGQAPRCGQAQVQGPGDRRGG